LIDASRQCGQEGPVLAGESHPVPTELSFKDGDLVAQREDLGVFVSIGHRQQP
jgi:hypothetical protein